MKLEEFYDLYWSQYLQVENEFIETFKYVSFSEENFKTYSQKFLELLLQIGSETDVSLKKLCKIIDPNSNKDETIGQYGKTINTYHKSLFNDKISLNIIYSVDSTKYINPINEYMTNTVNSMNSNKTSTTTPKQGMSWWYVYNGIKHNRETYYKQANQQNCLEGLLFLFDIMTNIYIKIIDNEKTIEKYTFPTSKLFNYQNANIDDSKINKGALWLNDLTKDDELQNYYAALNKNLF